MRALLLRRAPRSLQQSRNPESVRRWPRQNCDPPPGKFVTFANTTIHGDETAPRVSACAKPGGISQVVSERGANGGAQAFPAPLFRTLILDSPAPAR